MFGGAKAFFGVENITELFSVGSVYRYIPIQFTIKANTEVWAGARSCRDSPHNI